MVAALTSCRDEVPDRPIRCLLNSALSVKRSRGAPGGREPPRCPTYIPLVRTVWPSLVCVLSGVSFSLNVRHVGRLRNLRADSRLHRSPPVSRRRPGRPNRLHRGVSARRATGPAGGPTADVGQRRIEVYGVVAARALCRPSRHSAPSSSSRRRRDGSTVPCSESWSGSVTMIEPYIPLNT